MKAESYISLGEYVFRISQDCLFEQGDSFVIILLGIADVTKVIVYLKMIGLQFSGYQKTLCGFLNPVGFDRSDSITESAFKFIEFGLGRSEVNEGFVGSESLFPILFLEVYVSHRGETVGIARILVQLFRRLANDRNPGLLFFAFFGPFASFLRVKKRENQKSSGHNNNDRHDGKTGIHILYIMVGIRCRVNILR